MVYKTIYDQVKPLDYVGNNILIDTKRTVKIQFKEDCGKLYMNENIIEHLNDGEKLASDYMGENNIEQSVSCYQELMEKDNNIKIWLENSLNNAVYKCISNNDYRSAIAFLKTNTILFPESDNALDSLGEVYFFDKQYELAIEAMEKSLQYNPNNQNASKIIKAAIEFLEK